MREPPQYLSPAVLAERLGVTVETLKEWHSRKLGPPWMKVDGLIVYTTRSVEEWINSGRLKVKRVAYGRQKSGNVYGTNSNSRASGSARTRTRAKSGWRIWMEAAHRTQRACSPDAPEQDDGCQDRARGGGVREAEAR